jgi:hypothetical protein
MGGEKARDEMSDWCSRTTITPDCITEVFPVGSERAHYDEIVEQIAKANGVELCEAS